MKLTIKEYMNLKKIKSKQTVYNQIKKGLLLTKTINNQTFIVLESPINGLDSPKLSPENGLPIGLDSPTNSTNADKTTFSTSPKNGLDTGLDSPFSNIQDALINELKKRIEDKEKEIENLIQDKNYLQKKLDEANILSLKDKQVIQSLSDVIKNKDDHIKALEGEKEQSFFKKLLSKWF